MLWILVFLGIVQLDQTSAFMSTESTKQVSIPNTNLKANTIYQIGMKKFPLGTLTWSSEYKATYNYITIDNNPNHRQYFQPGRDWYGDTLWEFTPSSFCGNEFFLLSNRGRTTAFATFAIDDFTTESKHAHFMILERNHTRSASMTDFCIKPVEVKFHGVFFYQFKIKSKINGVVTWSYKKYGKNGSHYVQLDVRKTTSVYNEGGKWYEDTLFTVKPVDLWKLRPGGDECYEYFDECG